MEALKGSRETKTRTKVLAPAKVLTGLLYGPDLGLPMTCDTDESSSRVACRFTTHLPQLVLLIQRSLETYHDHLQLLQQVDHHTPLESEQHSL